MSIKSKRARSHQKNEPKSEDNKRSRLVRLMQERAQLATRIFIRTPHPGEDEKDPDYGF